MEGFFEGYTGVRLGSGQIVNDIAFTTLLCFLGLFAFIFHSNYGSFMKMLKDAVFVKERQNIFEKSVGSDDLFTAFTHFQAILLSSLFLFIFISDNVFSDIQFFSFTQIAIYFIALFVAIVLFYFLKQWLYNLIAYVFFDDNKYKIWKTGYNAIIGYWGVLLYIPTVWIAFEEKNTYYSAFAFVSLYILCRFAIIYKAFRIFYNKKTGLLYISLYLCTQEILPLVFLYEGTLYLYNFIKTSTLWH